MFGIVLSPFVLFFYSLCILGAWIRIQQLPRYRTEEILKVRNLLTIRNCENPRLSFVSSSPEDISDHTSTE